MFVLLSWFVVLFKVVLSFDSVQIKAIEQYFLAVVFVFPIF